MANWNLFLDDIRNPSYLKNDTREWLIARSAEQAVELVTMFGLPKHIAFDHDLGWDTLKPIDGSVIISAPSEGKESPSGMVFAKWLVDGHLTGHRIIPSDFTWSVHSSNPAGAANIDGLLKSFMREIYGV